MNQNFKFLFENVLGCIVYHRYDSDKRLFIIIQRFFEI